MEIKALTSITDVIPADGNLDVYLVDYGDYSRLTLWFVNHRTKFEALFEYRSIDQRGALGSLLPAISQEGIIWQHQSCVVRHKAFDPGTCHTTAYLTTITPARYYAYNVWVLQTWLPRNPYFTVIEGGSTTRKYIEESIVFLVGTSGVKSILPKHITYELVSDGKELVKEEDRSDLEFFYRSLVDVNSIQDCVALLNIAGDIYMPENTNTGQRYWKHSGARLMSKYDRIRATLNVNETVAADSCPTPCPPPPASACPDQNQDKTSALAIIIFIFIIVMAIVVIVVIIYYMTRETPAQQPGVVMVT